MRHTNEWARKDKHNFSEVKASRESDEFPPEFNQINVGYSGINRRKGRMVTFRTYKPSIRAAAAVLEGTTEGDGQSGHSLAQPAGTVTLCSGTDKQEQEQEPRLSWNAFHQKSDVNPVTLALKRAVPVGFMLGRFVTSRPHRETHFRLFCKSKLTFVPFYCLLLASSIHSSSSPTWS